MLRVVSLVLIPLLPSLPVPVPESRGLLAVLLLPYARHPEDVHPLFAVSTVSRTQGLDTVEDRQSVWSGKH